ncbi:hypothetical protein SAY86_024759 [Trapa natans]|uniref:PORR domain-containing protein n=1 Tax=Trapa natans TaxID=22666 RepID=A0AAN7M781_TRANT|nr:hypothetical protein SAY86_024759 [Trapa natans]
MRLLQTLADILARNKLSSDPSTQLFGPFNSRFQRRWRKPTVNARTRLEGRTLDTKLDKLLINLVKLKAILSLEHLMSTRKRGPFTSVQLMSRWRSIVGINVSIGAFIHKYPHIFKVFNHPIQRNLCCRITGEMKGLLEDEERAVRMLELDSVRKIKKLLMMSVNGQLHIHALRLIQRELGLPSDFRESILAKYSGDFRLVNLEIVELVDRDKELGVAVIEKWRENEFTEKWLSEYETRYAFPISFPTGFIIGRGMREKMKNWQRLPYVKPYERKEAVRVRTCGGLERFEKHAVGIIHELLCLTVEKLVEVERLAHFRKDFAMEVNIRELILKHPGIFYISIKGSSQVVFLREAYSRGCLVEPNPIYVVRRRMLELISMGCRNTRALSASKETQEKKLEYRGHEGVSARDGDWVLPILESAKDWSLER